VGHAGAKQLRSEVSVAELSATRTELLARRARIGLATQGRDLLKDKRAALMREFGRLSASVVEAVEDLGRRAAESRRGLLDAVSADGAEAVVSAALAASGDIATRLETRSVAGVRVVELEHEPVLPPRTQRGYDLLASTPSIDAAAAGFEHQLDRLLEVASRELSLRRPADEISRTTPRVNALEHVVIPQLESERDAIQAVLDERELEDRVRLRRARAAGQRRGADRPVAP
jgi:V/A-type H+-transporting ATPase subunit D